MTISRRSALGALGSLGASGALRGLGVRAAGREPLVVGDLLAAASRFQRGAPAVRANTTLPELRRLVGMRGGR